MEALSLEWEINTSRRQTNSGVSWQTLTGTFHFGSYIFYLGGCEIV